MSVDPSKVNPLDCNSVSEECPLKGSIYGYVSYPISTAQEAPRIYLATLAPPHSHFTIALNLPLTFAQYASLGINLFVSHSFTKSNKPSAYIY